MRRRLAALTLALGIGASVAAPGSATPARIEPDRSLSPSPAPLGHRGRWMTDARGRVVILHGVNVVAKLPPYEPAALGFDDDDAAFLASHGFNTVRLGVILKAIEPKPGVFDDTYLSSIARTARVLGRHGIYVLLDFHQDMFNERFDGEGFPDWAVQDDGLPAQPDGGFPANYFAMPALWRAYDHLWANDPVPGGAGLQDAYAAAWQHVADRFRRVPAVFGYDSFNEPWPGSDWESCLQPAGCPLFDATLTDFYTRVFGAIRKADRTKLVFYEPNPEMAGTGSDVYIGDTGDPNAGFSFHFYCLDALGWPGELGAVRCPAGEDRPFDVADEVSKRNGDALLMTEFGATDDLADLRLSVDLMDRHMMSWQYWAWWNRDPCCERPHEGLVNDPSKPPAGDNVKWDKLAVLVHPYPRAVAGTPVWWDFDRSPNVFELVYRTDPSIRAATEIFVPRLHYPRGYDVDLTGPARIISLPNSELLTIASTGPGEVHVTVTR